MKKCFRMRRSIVIARRGDGADSRIGSPLEKRAQRPEAEHAYRRRSRPKATFNPNTAGCGCIPDVVRGVFPTPKHRTGPPGRSRATRFAPARQPASTSRSRRA
ncbi:hypothetical protein GCM10009862_05740 [Microbacterium binotii]|uniref:Uncharacterized protein n=1 Tax=Microbacterium binotii TaxID=462710 RepID=A0ABP6BK40_9MICO